MYIHQNHSPRIAEPTWANPTDDQGGGANMMSVYQLTGDIKDVKNPLRHPWLVQVIARRHETACRIPSGCPHFL